MNIETQYQEWRALQPLSADNQKRLDDKFMLEFNYNSNHIEGNTLTYGQTISLLIHGKVDGNAPMHDYEEMKAHHAALEFVKQAVKEKERRPLTEAFIRQIHKIMLKEDYIVYEKRDGQQIQYTIHAGIYKTRPNSVKTQTGEIFEYASPEETPALMAELVAWYNAAEAEGNMSPLELAALFHYRYIRIHPFEDGNGRIARLMVNYILALHGYPMIVVQTDDKSNYLNALEKCDSIAGLIPAIGARVELEQITPLTEYLEKCLEQALRISIKAAKGEDIEEEDDVQKKLAILARNAQAKRGNIKRKNFIYVNEVIANFVTPFQEELKKQLIPFNQFYTETDVALYASVSQGLSLPISAAYAEKHPDEFVRISSDMVIHVNLSKPTILLPIKSKESANFYIMCKDESYEISLFAKIYSFRYGVLPTSSQQREWIKMISQVFYEGIESKVNEQK